MSLLNSEVLIKMLEASTNNKYMMFVSFKSNTTDDTSGGHDVISGFGGVRIVQSLVLLYCFVDPVVYFGVFVLLPLYLRVCMPSLFFL
jgi:hypothetical protein